MSSETPIKLIQISDPHLFADAQESMYGLRTLNAFEAVVDAIKDEPFDLGLLTGDLSQDETETSYQYIKDSLYSLNKPFLLLPGNHDNYSLMQEMFSKSLISCDKQRIFGDWQILMLNSQVIGEVGGKITDEELNWLEAVLAQRLTPYTVIFLHHHPVPMGSKWLDRIGLNNPERLFELLAEYPEVKALLWGHVHQIYEEERAELHLLSCPSTCIQFNANCDDFELDIIAPGYRWLNLFDDGRIETGIKRLSKIPGEIDPSQKGYAVE